MYQNIEPELATLAFFAYIAISINNKMSTVHCSISGLSIEEGENCYLILLREATNFNDTFDNGDVGYLRPCEMFEPLGFPIGVVLGEYGDVSWYRGEVSFSDQLMAHYANLLGAELTLQLNELTFRGKALYLGLIKESVLQLLSSKIYPENYTYLDYSKVDKAKLRSLEDYTEQVKSLKVLCESLSEGKDKDTLQGYLKFSLEHSAKSLLNIDNTRGYKNFLYAIPKGSSTEYCQYLADQALKMYAVYCNAYALGWFYKPISYARGYGNVNLTRHVVSEVYQKEYITRVCWLDDLRDPELPEWKSYIQERVSGKFEVVWIKDYDGFVSDLTKYWDSSLPDVIFFDHDLSTEHYAPESVWHSKEAYMEWESKLNSNEKNGKHCATYLIDYCLDNNLEVPNFYSQSANPYGRDNILTSLNNFRTHQYNEKARELARRSRK